MMVKGVSIDLVSFIAKSQSAYSHGNLPKKDGERSGHFYSTLPLNLLIALHNKNNDTHTHARTHALAEEEEEEEEEQQQQQEQEQEQLID